MILIILLALLLDNHKKMNICNHVIGGDQNNTNIWYNRVLWTPGHRLD